jgi:hypothetical protein
VSGQYGAHRSSFGNAARATIRMRNTQLSAGPRKPSQKTRSRPTARTAVRRSQGARGTRTAMCAISQWGWYTPSYRATTPTRGRWTDRAIIHRACVSEAELVIHLTGLSAELHSVSTRQPVSLSWARPCAIRATGRSTWSSTVPFPSGSPQPEACVDGG